jgi:hypothetical protein
MSPLVHPCVVASQLVPSATAVPAQTPLTHASSLVHVFPSSQLAPSGSAAPPVHTPASHVSAVVHTLPSLHAVPSAFAGFEHAPVAGSQVPTPWH